MRMSRKNVSRQLIAALVLVITPFTISHAGLIFDFGFTDNTQGTVEGQVMLEAFGSNYRASGISITSSPFAGSITGLDFLYKSENRPSTVQEFNTFIVDANNSITAADFVGFFTNSAGVQYRFDINADPSGMINSSNANVATLIGNGFSIAGNNALPNIFNFVPTPNEVPSPSPLILFSAGISAFFLSRKKLKQCIVRA